MCSSIDSCNLDFLASNSFVAGFVPLPCFVCRVVLQDLCEKYYRLAHHSGDCFPFTRLRNDWHLLEVSCQIPGYQNVSMKNEHRVVFRRDGA